MTSVQTRRGIWATSSKTTPSRYMPRRESGLLAPNSRMRAPFSKSARSSVSLNFTVQVVAAQTAIPLQFVPDHGLGLAVEGAQYRPRASRTGAFSGPG